MIARLRGEVVVREPDRVVVDVGGVGYLVHVPVGSVVPAVGRTVVLHTSLQVREDSMTLYGFVEPAALDLFLLLVSASGVGPRLALAALGTHPPEVVLRALAAGDVAVLTAVPGIGRKLADRMLLELADRLPTTTDTPAGTTAAPDPRLDAVRAALAGFGFTAAEVSSALAGVVPGPDEPEAVLLRQALRVLDAGRAPMARP